MRIFLFLQFGTSGTKLDDIKSFLGGSDVEVLKTLDQSKLNKDSLLIASLPLEILFKMAAEYECSVININPNFKYIMLVKNSNSKREVNDIAENLSNKFGLTYINEKEDTSSVAPVIKKEEGAYYSSDISLLKVNEKLRNGEKINVFSDLNVFYGDEIINSNYLNVTRFVGINVYDRLVQNYRNANAKNEVSIFITHFNLDDELNEIERSENVLLITPKNLILGIEYVRRASPEYAVDGLLAAVRDNHININAINNIAMLSLATKSDIVPYLTSKIDAECIGYDSKRFVTRREKYGLSELLALTEFKDGNLIISNKDLRNGIVFSLVSPSGLFANFFLIKS